MINQSTQVRSAKNRLVKVENLGETDYHEDFKGVIWTIPARGFVLKPVLEANRFVGQFKAPLRKENGRWERFDGQKPLRIAELSAKEREEHEGLTDKEHKLAEENENQQMALTCMKCGFHASNDRGLKIHTKMAHKEELEGDIS